MILRPKHAVGFDFFGQLFIILLGFLVPIFGGEFINTFDVFKIIFFLQCVLLSPFQFISSLICTILYSDIDTKRLAYWVVFVVYFTLVSLLVSINRAFL